MEILQMLQRRRERKMSQEHLSPDVIAILQRESGSEITPPEVQHFQFVVAIADDTIAAEVPAMIGKISQIFITPGHSTISNSSAPCSPPPEEPSWCCFPQRAIK
jgi:hypothetical protein